MQRTRWAGAVVLGLLMSLPGTAEAQMLWQEEPVPPPEHYGHLVTAASAHGETWAFGGANESYPVFHSLAYQRGPDGWRAVPVPDVGRLYESEVAGPGDVWAIGEPTKSPGGDPVHWKDGKWTPTPFDPPEGHLFAVEGMTAFAPEDVWAVGYTGVNGAETSRGLVQHWDGTAWTDIPVPEDVAAHWALNDVDGVAPDDVWALGDIGSENEDGGVALHWDGAAWTTVPMPPIETTESQYVEVTEVEALAPDDVWATGNVVSYDQAVPTEPLLLHWNGSAWSLVEGPVAGEPRGELVHVGEELWSLGERVWHFDGETWRSEQGPTHGVPVGGAALEDGRLFVVGGKGRGAPYLLPFAVTHNP